MTSRSVAHGTFCIERVFDASPARVYRAFADPEQKRRWACHEDWRTVEMEVRRGGREISRGGDPGGPVYTFEGLYQDVVENERLVIAYTMDRDDVRLSASVQTLEFRAEGEKTRLVFTDMGAFLDGHDTPQHREAGSGIGLDNLEQFLRRERAAA